MISGHAGSLDGLSGRPSRSRLWRGSEAGTSSRGEPIMFDIGLDTAGDVLMCFYGFFIVCGLADWIGKRNKV